MILAYEIGPVRFTGNTGVPAVGMDDPLRERAVGVGLRAAGHERLGPNSCPLGDYIVIRKIRSK